MPEFDADYWEQRYAEHGPRDHPPSSVLVDEVGGLRAGTALEVGCGEGANAVWLAQQGWQVTALDVSATALSRAEDLAAGAGVADRVDLVRADVAEWDLLEAGFDLVMAHYVHPSGSREEFLRRLAAAVVPGGTLLVVDHDHAEVDAHVHATPEDLAAGLDAGEWRVEVSERRTREVHTGHGVRTLHDSILRATRH